MRRAGLYARVSTSDQAGGLAVQLEQLRRYGEARELEVREFVDEGISGSTATRPGLQALLEAARRRRIDAIVITKLDRLARNVRHLVELAGELQVLGVDLVVLDQAIDTSTPIGRLMFVMLGAIAEFERDLIRERVLAGVRRAQLRGTKSGRRIGRPRRVELDGAEISARVGRGESLGAIARSYGPHVHATQVRRALGRYWSDKPRAGGPPELPRIPAPAAAAAGA